MVSGYTEGGLVILPFFVLIYTESIKKSIKNGFINILPFFIVRVTVWYICGCSVVSVEDICGDFNVLRPCDLGVHSITRSQKCQGVADNFLWGLTRKKYKRTL